jgi:hypothetical protein
MGRPTILMLCSVLLIGGCNRDAANALIGKPSAKPKASALANKGPNADQQTAGMTIAVGIGKATLPAQLKFESREPAQARRGAGCRYCGFPADGGTLQVTATDGLDTSKAQTEIALPALDGVSERDAFQGRGFAQCDAHRHPIAHVDHNGRFPRGRNSETS